MIRKRKNIISFLAILFLLFILNLPVFFVLGRLFDWLSILLNGDFFNTLFSLLFFGWVLFLNILFLNKYFKRILKYIEKEILGRKYLRGAIYYVSVFYFLLFLILFKIWNIDYVLIQRYSQLRLITEELIGFGRGVFNEKQIKWGNLPIEQINNEDILKTSIYSDYGRYMRTHRWHTAIINAEKNYNIEPYLLAGLIMQESMGNPLQLNNSGDGGAGLMMFQPGTAREFKLDIYGNSRNTGRDVSHGKALKELVRNNKLDYRKLSVIDERFHIEKSIQAGARFLSKLYKRHGSWDKAISAYNRGKPAVFPQRTGHVRMVRHFQHYYRNKSDL